MKRESRAPLVDFCNQSTPRARPRDRLNPSSARLGATALHGPTWGDETAGADPSSSNAVALSTCAHGTVGTSPLAPIKRETAFAGLLRWVVPPLAVRLQPRFHGPGARGLSPARRLPSRSLATEASPRPDPLGHLVSRARCDAGWRGRIAGSFRSRAHEPFTNPPDEPACAWLAGRPACAEPPTSTRGSPGLRLRGLRENRDHRSEGRLTRSSAKKSAIRCTRGAFRG